MMIFKIEMLSGELSTKIVFPLTLQFKFKVELSILTPLHDLKFDTLKLKMWT